MEFNEFKRRKSFWGYFFAAVIGAIIGGLLLLIFGPAALFNKFHQPDINENIPQIQTQAIKDDDKDSITYAANSVIPSVVGITNVKTEKGMLDNNNVQGVGSGVIVDSSGYILTNNHVAGLNSKNISVSLYDGREVSGKAIWADPVLDLSVIKISGDKLKAAPLGDSSNIKIAESAIAIGNPLGLKFQRTVTAGIISAFNRTIDLGNGEFMEDLIQTDASINPGNSGGPLVNSSGEVIGINTVKVSSAEGIGFAVPINIVKPIIKSIKETGTFVTPIMGISGFDKEIAAYYDYKIDTGIYVFKSVQGTPAYNAGIREGDVILTVNGRDIETMIDLKQALYEAGAGNPVKLSVKTPLGTTKNVELTLKASK